MEVNYGESSSFVDQRSWQEKAACYHEFVNRFRGKRLVALEFGVGRRNQMIKGGSYMEQHKVTIEELVNGLMDHLTPDCKHISAAGRCSRYRQAGTEAG